MAIRRRFALLISVVFAGGLALAPNVSRGADAAQNATGAKAGIETGVEAGIETPPSAEQAAAPDQLRFEPWRDLKESLANFPDRTNQVIFTTTVLSMIGSHQMDPSAREYFAGRRRIGDLDKLGNDVLGTGVPGALLGTGFWFEGERRANVLAVHAGQAQLEALASTGLVTAVIKYAAHRDRPDGSDAYSFPSGHTSTMATSAMVLQEFYGWRVGAPIFALTALTAVSRLSEDRHWLSDTVGGAGIGIMIAHAVSRAHLRRMSDNAMSSSPETFFVWPEAIDGGVQLRAAYRM